MWANQSPARALQTFKPNIAKNERKLQLMKEEHARREEMLLAAQTDAAEKEKKARQAWVKACLLGLKDFTQESRMIKEREAATKEHKTREVAAIKALTASELCASKRLDGVKKVAIGRGASRGRERRAERMTQT